MFLITIKNHVVTQIGIKSKLWTSEPFSNKFERVSPQSSGSDFSSKLGSNELFVIFMMMDTLCSSSIIGPCLMRTFWAFFLIVLIGLNETALGGFVFRGVAKAFA